MRKTLLAAAALAFIGQAQAQSSVTLFGNIDATLTYGHGSTANRTQLSSGGLATSLLGFRGVEDLGGGMHAGFWLEAQIAMDSGAGSSSNTNNQSTGNAACAVTTTTTTTTTTTPPVAGTTLASTSTSTSTSACTTALNGAQGITFNRRSVLTFGGNWGQVILGRDYSPVFWSNVAFDPFTVNGVGSNQAFLSQFTGATAPYAAYTGAPNGLPVRASNSVSYTYGYAPNASTLIGTGGFYAHAMHFFGENASNAVNKKDGTGDGLRLGYTSGPLNVAASYLSTRYVAGNVRTWSLGGSWDFGVAKVRGLYVDDSAGVRSGRGYLLAVTAPAGPGLVRASYSGYRTDAGARPESRKLALGYVYDLSKRTQLYFTAAQVRNSGGAAQALNASTTAANTTSTGYDLGLRHSF